MSLALLFSTGCSLTFDFTECETDSDCQALETDGPLVCQANTCIPVDDVECTTDDDCTTAPFTSCENNVCVDPSVNNMTDMDVNNTNNNTNNTNNMMDMDVEPDMGADMTDMEGQVTCEQTSECPGETELCVSGVCVEATSEDCSAPYGELSATKTVILGSILPMSPPYDTIGPPLSKSIELAVDDFNRIGGIPNGSIIWVNCDDRGNSDIAKRAASHLVENLGVQGIIGPLFSTPFIATVRDVTKDAGVFTITPTATADALTNLSDNDLAWRTIATDKLQAAAIVAKVREIAPGTITVFYKNDAYGVGLFNELNPQLAEVVGSNQNVTGVVYEDPAAFGFDQQQITAEFGRAVGTAPTTSSLLIFIGTSEATGLAQLYYQSKQPLPSLFSHGAVTEFARVVATTPSLQPLLTGVGQNIFHPVNFGIYQNRFDSAFPGEPPLTISTLNYDATVLTLLGMAAVPDGEEITGTKIAANMARISDKMTDEVSYENSSFISEAIGKLENGENLDYVGVSGEVDFDLDTGNVISQDFLQLVTVQDQNMVWQLTPNRAFTLAPEVTGVSNRFGLWFDLCGASAPFQTCTNGTQTCTNSDPMDPTSSEICVDLCDTGNGMCSKPDELPPMIPNPMMCEPTGMGSVGICVPSL